MLRDHRVACQHPSCNCSFQSELAMLQHCKDCHDVHPAPPLHEKVPCPICNRSFPSASALIHHLCASSAPAHNHDPESAAALATAHISAPPAPSILPDDLQLHGVACNDCGRCFATTDFMHRHQWDSTGHTRVSQTRNPNFASRARACSQCPDKFASADDLEQHYVEQHPISEILKAGEEGIWRHLAEDFRTAWTKPSIKLYEVHRVFKVYNPGWRRKEFEELRKEIKQEMNNQKVLKEENVALRQMVLRNGNELRRYHGTTVKCRLGQPTPPDGAHLHNGTTALSLCAEPDCGMCRILQTGFKKSKCKVERFQRFGPAIYCSSISSKASAYVKCTTLPNISSADRSLLSYIPFSSYFRADAVAMRGNYKVMMVCKVLAGRPYHSTHNMLHLKEPPPGYHSVQGDPGVHLNYDELVVYDDRGILPEFIILYSSSE